MTPLQLLERIERGEITVQRALREWNKSKQEHTQLRLLSFLKIHVEGAEKPIKLIIPLTLVSFGLSAGRLALSLGVGPDNEDFKRVQTVFSSIPGRDLRALLRALKHCDGQSLVEVRDRNGLVIIRVVSVIRS